MKLSEILKQYRITNNLSMREFAKRCNVSNAYISLIESGETKSPSLDMISKLAAGMLMDSNDLIKAMDDDTVISVKPKKNSGVRIPVLGKVIAGIPIEAIEEVIDYEEITEQMARTGDFFALQITGDSMEPEMREKDIVIVKKQNDIDSGQIGIVLVNGDEATVKKVLKKENGIMLVPFNNNYDPLFYDQYDIETKPVNIIGRVVELRKKY